MNLFCIRLRQVGPMRILGRGAANMMSMFRKYIRKSAVFKNNFKQ